MPSKKRDPKKLAKILKQKGYPEGKTPKGKEAHHKKAVAAGGKTIKQNIIVIPKGKHKRIHKKRRKLGKV